MQAERQAELHPRGGRGGDPQASGGGRALPEVRGRARDQRLPTAGQVPGTSLLSYWHLIDVFLIILVNCIDAENTKSSLIGLL